MSDAPDLEELTRRYLDLWQDQVSALAADPDFAEQWKRWLEAMSRQAGEAANAGAMWPALFSGFNPAMAGLTARPGAGPAPADTSGRDRPEGEADGGARTGRGTDSAAGAAPAAGASDGGGVDLAQLAGRLAALEERVARLEAKPAGSRRGAARKPRKKQS